MRYLIKLDKLYLADFVDEEVETTPSQYEATRYRKEELKAVLWDATRFRRQDGQRTDKIRVVRLVTKGGKVGRAVVGKRYVAKVGDCYLTQSRTEATVFTKKQQDMVEVRWVQLVAKTDFLDEIVAERTEKNPAFPVLVDKAFLERPHVAEALGKVAYESDPRDADDGDSWESAHPSLRETYKAIGLGVARAVAESESTIYREFLRQTGKSVAAWPAWKKSGRVKS